MGADLNGYAYVSGGVLKNVDPLGLCGNDGAGGACPTADSEQGPDTGAEGQGGRRDDYADGSGSGSSASVHFSPILNTAYAEPERAIAVEAPRVTPQTPRHGTFVLAAGATAAGYATAMIEGQVPVGGAFAGVAGDLAVGTARLPDSVKLGWSLGRMYGGFQLLVQGGAEVVLGGAAEPVTAGASTPVFAHEVGVIPNGLASISGGFGVFMSVLSGSGSGGGGGTTAAKAWTAPKITVNRHGQLTNGTYTVDAAGMAPHKTGSLAKGKSQWLSGVDAEKAVLDAAAKADAEGLWVGSKAKVPGSTDVGALGSTGELTPYINVYRTKTGFVHGAPGTPP